jgi:beta-galactosidase
MILRDRNHPSVFIWSIGNEIPEQRDSTGISITKELAGIVRNLDKTRPITSACDDPQPSNYIISSGVLDLIGYNYHEKTYADFPKTFPGKKFIATETTSAIATRGSYDMPSDSVHRWPDRFDGPFIKGNADLSCSSYDNCCVPWGSTHEETWKIIKKHDFLSGMFIWTGFDYLGEPTPYPWPARSSYFGILDLSGFPKDAYYLYQSQWTEKNVLHIFPHWNWTPGKIIDVWAYTNCDEVEIFLNGRSLGVKQTSDDDLHMAWKVPFEAGTLLGVGRKAGNEVLRQEIKTASDPARIILSPDRSTINSDGSDLSFVKVTIADKNNVPVPYADNLINFKIEGNATVAGVDNGNQVSMESFKSDNRKAFHGMCLIVLKSGSKTGEVKLNASSSGLESAQVTINLK